MKELCFDVTTDGEVAIIEKRDHIIKSVITLTIEEFNALLQYSTQNYNPKTNKFDFYLEE